MRVHIASDHAGLELSRYLVARLRSKGYRVIEHGPTAFDPEDDYPAFCFSTAEAVAAERQKGLDSLGIVIGGSGNGEQIAANKVRGIRAALAWNLKTAALARRHNDANVVAIGGREHSIDEAIEIVEAFLAAPFLDEERHIRRIAQISRYEGRQSPSLGIWPMHPAPAA